MYAYNLYTLKTVAYTLLKKNNNKICFRREWKQKLGFLVLYFEQLIAWQLQVDYLFSWFFCTAISWQGGAIHTLQKYCYVIESKQ